MVRAGGHGPVPVPGRSLGCVRAWRIGADSRTDGHGQDLRRRGSGRSRSVPPAAPTTPPPLTVLWLTPLRALAADTGLALRAPRRRAAAAVDGRRSHRRHAFVRRARGQDRRLPTALVTTPESLTLLLSRADWRERFAHLAAIVVDEWHELMAIEARRAGRARARAAAHGRRATCRVWGLSATLANLDEALACLLGVDGRAAASSAASTAKTIVIETARPATIERFPVGAATSASSCCRKSCARSTARARRSCSPTCARRPRSGTRRSSRRGPTGPGRIALHHGSLEREVRDWVEDGLRSEHAARRRLHVEPRPRRRLRAGRPGAADRQSQRRRAAAATRGPQRPPARARYRSVTVRADAGAGVGRGGGRARSRGGTRDRGAHADRRTGSTRSPSISSPARSAAASGPPDCCAEIRSTHAYARTDRRRNGSGRSISSSTAAPASTRTPSTAAS